MDQRVGRILFPLLGVAAFAAVGLLIPHFLTAANLLNVVRQSSIVGICAVGMTMVIVILGIDLSVAGLIALCPMVSGLLMLQGFPIVLSIIAGIIAGIAMGLFNGLMVAKLGVPPFITTLVVGQISQGLALIMNNGHSIGGFPASYVYLGNGSVLGIPVSDLLLIVMMAIGIFITQFTPTGNRIYALGGNETVVRQEGINVDGLKLFVYTFSGFCASIAGILLSAQLDTVHPIQGEPYLLDAIAACAIGGVSLAGGEGRVALAVAGALIIGSLRNVLDLLGFIPFSRTFWSGRLSSWLSSPLACLVGDGPSPHEKNPKSYLEKRECRHPGSPDALGNDLRPQLRDYRQRRDHRQAVCDPCHRCSRNDHGSDDRWHRFLPWVRGRSGFNRHRLHGKSLGCTYRSHRGGHRAPRVPGRPSQRCHHPVYEGPRVHNHPRDWLYSLRRITTRQRGERHNPPAAFAPGGGPNGPSGASDIGIHRGRDHRFGLVSGPQDRIRPALSAFGFNPRAAFLSGLPTARVNVLTYVLCSSLAALAGLLLTIRVNAAQPNMGGGIFTFEIITAAIVGGTSLFGGIGSVIGSLFGVLIIKIIENCINLMNISYHLYLAVQGGIILTVIVMEKIRNRAA